MPWILLTSGRGPVECQLAVARISDIICRAAGDHHQTLVATIIDYHATDAGALSALIAIDGPAADIFARSWQGTIEWKCASPLRTTRRKNWFIGARIIVEPPVSTTWNVNDVRFETYRASGPGGQHIQKTNSAVRVIHIPTGQTAQAQEERSQYRNKSLALARLGEHIAAHNAATDRAVERSKWSSHNTVVRGESVKVFVGEAFRLEGTT